MIDALSVPICSGKHKIEPSINSAPKFFITEELSSTSVMLPVDNWTTVLFFKLVCVFLSSTITFQAS